MVTCDILAWKCIIVNELFGSIALAIVGFIICYFMISGRLKFGAELTIDLIFPVAIIISLFLGGFTIVYAFATMIVALMIGFVFQKIIGNR